MTLLKKISTIILVCLLFFSSLSLILSDDSGSELEKKKQEIEQIHQELNRLQGEKQTLSSTIKYLDSKIYLTQVEITQTEDELSTTKTQISDLSQKIDSLDISLSDLTQQLLHRVNVTYKKSRIRPILTILTSNNLNTVVSRLKYLQSSQKHNKQLIVELETARTDFDQQKQLKQEKEEELNLLTQKLETQKVALAAQQRDKKYILDVTKNDEKKFQSDLAKKQAELEAIQSIIAGKGDETEVSDINEGDTIASVIPGVSACSSGSHLHFEVAKDGVHHNPAGYLKSTSITWDNAPDGPFDFTGSWNWPLDDPIRLTQGYGMTFYASTLRYYGGQPHTGIDIINTNLKVKAVKPGKLYRGAIACGGGTLRYVRVQQADSIDTYYLHINY